MYHNGYDGLKYRSLVVVKSKKQRKIAPLLVLLGILTFGLILAYFVNDTDVVLLNPKGMVANEQHWLLIVSTLIMFGFGLPVILTIYFFAWKYREGNQQSTYAPDTKNSKTFLVFAWGGPIATVIVLASLMLPATQRLKPQAPIKADKEQLVVQVVALRWKWLFIYPEYNVATVNFVQIPVDTPVRFELTADEAPMNAFWIPNLGGMLYAMTGHINQLNLMATAVGDYPGKTAEISGQGYAGMKFTARASTQRDFDAWAEKVKSSSVPLTDARYQKLLEPSENNPPAFYSNPSPDLYGAIVSKYDGSQAGTKMEHGGAMR